MYRIIRIEDGNCKQNAPLIVKMQFIIICITIMTEVYMYAWPADYVKNMVNYTLYFYCFIYIYIKLIFN